MVSSPPQGGEKGPGEGVTILLLGFAQEFLKICFVFSLPDSYNRILEEEKVQGHNLFVVVHGQLQLTKGDHNQLLLQPAPHKYNVPFPPRCGP